MSSNYVYLDSLISDKSGFMEEIKRRIRVTKTVMNWLTSVLKDKSITKGGKTSSFASIRCIYVRCREVDSVSM